MDIKFTWHTSWYNKTDDIDSLFLVQEWMQIKIVYVKSEETGIHWMKMEYVEWPMNGSINWIEMFIRQSKNIEKKKTFKCNSITSLFRFEYTLSLFELNATLDYEMNMFDNSK